MASIRTLERRFGKLVVKNGFATKEQINLALKEKKRLAAGGQAPFLADILIQQEVITQAQRDAIVENHEDFKEQLAPSAPQDTDQTEEGLTGIRKVRNDSGYELTITADKMAGYICPLETPAPQASLESIKNLIQSENLSFGIVDDERIMQYLASEPAMEEPWLIAEGNPVRPGRPAEVKYFFDTSPLKAGTLDKSGAIDFKNRGKIPFVEQGTVIAEIVPPVLGQPGKDIYGNSIMPDEYHEIILSCGEGVNRQEQDPLKFVALTRGHPTLVNDATLCVSEVLTISGDIGIETGHVEFDGDIHVAGSIQEGYRVRGRTLRADEIFRADVQIDGDIIIVKGIIGATVRTDGSIRAKHVRDTVVDALGDINIETEAYESRIGTNGVFNIAGGTILCSRVSAMRGIHAAAIGREGSAPCELVVGVDNRQEGKIERIKLEIAEKEAEQETSRSQIKELEDEQIALETELGKLIRKEESATRRSLSLSVTFEKIKAANDRQNIIKLLQLIKHTNQELDGVKAKMVTVLEEQDRLENRIQECRMQIKESEVLIEELGEDIDSIIELAKMRNSAAVVKVSGTIYGGTSIRSYRASMKVKGNHQRVQIQETKKSRDDSEYEYELTLSPLR